MYEKMMSDLKTQMKPAMDLAETNKQIMEKLFNVQKTSSHEVVNASMEQFKALVQCQDPKAAVELQVTFLKALEAKLTDTAAQSVAIINEAKQAFSSVVEESSKKVVVETEKAVKKATKKAA